MWCSAFFCCLFTQSSSGNSVIMSTAIQDFLSMMAIINFIRADTNWMDQDMYLQEIYIGQNFRHKWSFSSSLAHGRGWCETSHPTNCPMPRGCDRFTTVKYNTLISQHSTGQVTGNWIGTPEEIFQKTEPRSSVYLQFQPSGCAPVCSNHYSESCAMGACYLIMYV